MSRRQSVVAPLLLSKQTHSISIRCPEKRGQGGYRARGGSDPTLTGCRWRWSLPPLTNSRYKLYTEKYLRGIHQSSTADTGRMLY